MHVPHSLVHTEDLTSARSATPEKFTTRTTEEREDRSIAPRFSTS